MRSHKYFGFVIATLFILLLSVVVVSAQDVAATEDPMLTQMRMKGGACPEGAAQSAFDQMNMTTGTTSTQEPMLEPTQDMSMTSTQEPMAGATEDTGMTTATGVKCLFGWFTGAAEIPGPGDDDGWGFVFVSVDPETDEVCYDVAVANITLPADAMHIHVNSVGLSGDVVVPFPTAPDADGKASGCANAEVEGLADAIAFTPDGYYVNVHTSDFPDGAIRAQLSEYNIEAMPGTGMGIEIGEITPEAGAQG